MKYSLNIVSMFNIIYSKDAIFIIPVIPLKDRVEKFLKNNGYDVEALVQNGIHSNVS